MTDQTERAGGDYQEQLREALRNTSLRAVAEIVGKGETLEEQRAWAEEELQMADALVHRDIRTRLSGGFTDEQAAYRELKSNYHAAFTRRATGVAEFLAALPYTSFAVEEQLAMADACYAAHRLDEGYMGGINARRVVEEYLNGESHRLNQADPNFADSFTFL